MVRKKDGFLGERSIVLAPMVVEMEESDSLVSSLYLTDIGFYPQASYHYRNRQQGISQHVLIYCVDGNGWYRIDGKEYKVKKNQYFILPAGLPHSYGAEEGGSWTIYWVHFRGELAYEYAKGAASPQTINVTTESRISDRNNIFEEILNTLEDGQDLEHLRYTSSLLHHYLASMRYLKQYRNAAKPKDAEKDDSVISAAIHYMKENMERKLSLQEIARYVGYSPCHFSTMFKKETGNSPLNYFNELKIQRACHLLAHTDMKINQVSMKIGIDDCLYFSRLFSKTMGMSPRDYRETAVT